MGQYKPMPKMKTTEPSVELKLKKGGKVKMQMGGSLPVAPAAEMPAPRRRMARPAVAPMARPMMRKKGGEMETPAMHKAEMKKMGKVEKELKQHEGKPASKAHRGLKNGGAPKAGPDTIGGLAGGLEATRVNPKKTTGGVRNSNAGGYKNGGAAKFLNNMSTAKQTKSLNTKSGKVKNGPPAGYKNGGAAKFISNMSSGDHPKQAAKKTGQIKQQPAGYKDGGHTAMKSGGMSGFKSGGKMCKY
jgi:hypothetical protein